MPFKDSDMHAVSIVGTIVLTAALFTPAVFLSTPSHADDISLDNMEAIEASIAQNKTPHAQPVKKVRLPDPVEKPEGISHDETKKPVEKELEHKKPAKPDDPKDPFAKFKHNNDD